MGTDVTKYKIQRIRKGWRQIDVAEKTGLAQIRISQIERGIPPKQREKKILCEVLEIIGRLPLGRCCQICFCHGGPGLLEEELHAMGRPEECLCGLG